MDFDYSKGGGSSRGHMGGTTTAPHGPGPGPSYYPTVGQPVGPPVNRPPPPVSSSSSSGTGIRVAIKPEYRITPPEAKQELDLIDIADALKLLSPTFNSEEVRANALEGAEDEEQQCYMLQLVQAVRFEYSDKLMQFLARCSAHNNDLAHCLRWHLMVELCYAKGSDVIDKILEDFFLKHKLEGREDDDGVKMLQGLVRQTKLIAQLRTTMEYVKTVENTRKIESLQERLAGPMSELINSEKEIPLPLDPKVLITGIIPAESSIFSSAKQPLSLTFKTADGGKCKVMFKTDDDLRQDQLVTQMVLLTDRLLKKEGLDLQLTPYKVLATGHREGMIEVIPSKPLGQICLEYQSLENYLKQCHPDAAICLETFIKSCAGYCLITYILGVGDRNPGNILLRDDGRLFHVDFGQILDKDPKMILYEEMVEAMGGAGSKCYKKFKYYCCEAYIILRKSSKRILDLFRLMAGSSISAFASDPEKVILELEKRFRLDLVDDKKAKEFFQSLIHKSQRRRCPTFPTPLKVLEGLLQTCLVPVRMPRGRRRRTPRVVQRLENL